MSKLRIALIDDDLERAQFIQESLLSHDFQVVACLILNDLNMVHVKGIHADVILLNMDHPHRDIIESCVSQYELPTVLFTQNSNKDTIKSAIDAGITAYIVDGIDPTKLESILEISIEQFRKHKKLLNDLKETQDKLIDRKDIDKAKALLKAAGVTAPLTVNLLGFAGGLVMSAIKRDRGVKDWGHMIEGHGGMLDRMDSVCFAAPIFFHFVRYWWA
mgnify:CR=1 FL=1